MCYGLPVHVFQGKNHFRTPKRITGCPWHLVRNVIVPYIPPNNRLFLVDNFFDIFFHFNIFSFSTFFILRHFHVSAFKFSTFHLSTFFSSIFLLSTFHFRHFHLRPYSNDSLQHTSVCPVNLFLVIFSLFLFVYLHISYMVWEWGRGTSVRVRAIRRIRIQLADAWKIRQSTTKRAY
jgi:hypothetical protein